MKTRPGLSVGEPVDGPGWREGNDRPVRKGLAIRRIEKSYRWGRQNALPPWHIEGYIMHVLSRSARVTALPARPVGGGGALVCGPWFVVSARVGWVGVGLWLRCKKKTINLLSTGMGALQSVILSIFAKFIRIDFSQF